MLIKFSTDKSVSETAAALQTAVEANHFGVMQVHNLKETMAKKGVEFAHECLIFEVCQPQQAKKVLDQKHERVQCKYSSVPKSLLFNNLIFRSWTVVS